MEYTILLVLVTLGAAVGIAALGVPLLNLFYYAQTILGAPIP